MKKIETDIAVIGGGPAGLAAAISAYKQGVDVLIIERDLELGGILPQCIHSGFGVEIFDDELTGPEFAQRYINKVKEYHIPVKLNTMVLNIKSDKTIYAVNKDDGVLNIKTKAVILAMGCRERTRGNIRIPGTRPAGVFTAGLAQRLVNIDGLMPGKEFVILGSGDIGMIMARRLTLEGAEVKAVVEILPYPSGLIRNKVQCLDDFDIPLILRHTVTEIIGKKRIEKIIISKVDDNWNPIKGTEREFDCDTLLLSVGLIPENELSKKVGVKLDGKTNGPIVDNRFQTNVKGIFACGNVLHVNDLVDNVSFEGSQAGKYASLYVKEEIGKLKSYIETKCGRNVGQLVPHKINKKDFIDPKKFFIRVKSPETDVYMKFLLNDELIYKKFKRFALPSEMIIVELPAQEKEINADITVEIQPKKKEEDD
ncbi:MAG: FAD-binding protein [Candidatus Lokiarchaeota archaeon]|nr:FAD-binding protein [Candidatus Lokiarchaeota archaeon]